MKRNTPATLPQLRVLALMHEENDGPSSVGRLQVHQIPGRRVSKYRVVKNLVENGLATRSDASTTILYITEEGRRVLEENRHKLDADKTSMAKRETAPDAYDFAFEPHDDQCEIVSEFGRHGHNLVVRRFHDFYFVKSDGVMTQKWLKPDEIVGYLSHVAEDGTSFRT